MSDTAKRNPIKARFDLIDPEWLMQVAEGLGKGAAKYGDNNWRKSRLRGVDSPINHALKHLNNYMAGVPDDGGDDHLINAVMNLMFAWHYDKHPEKFGREWPEQGAESRSWAQPVTLADAAAEMKRVEAAVAGLQELSTADVLLVPAELEAFAPLVAQHRQLAIGVLSNAPAKLGTERRVPVGAYGSLRFRREKAGWQFVGADNDAPRAGLGLESANSEALNDRT